MKSALSPADVRHGRFHWDGWRLVLVLLGILLVEARPLAARTFSNDFAVVFIDAQTEARLGPFPITRAYYAKAIQRAAALHARGVVFKFFFDQPAASFSDHKFAESIRQFPVLLQACLDNSELHPNPLPGRFMPRGVDAVAAVSGRSGWLPLPDFAAGARDIGFVDFATTNVPMIESYQGHAVKSLLLCALEMATGRTAVVRARREISFGAERLPLDARNCVAITLPGRDACPYIPFHRFLAGDIPASTLAGKVVVIGYDGSRMHTVPTALGPVNAHRFFIYALMSLEAQLGS